MCARTVLASGRGGRASEDRTLLRLALAGVLALALVVPVLADDDSDTDTTTTTTTSTTTSDDVSTFSVSGGTPGSWVEAAIARHNSLIAARVTASQSGTTPGVRVDDSDSSTSSSSSSTTTDSLTSTLTSLLSDYTDSTTTDTDTLTSYITSLLNASGTEDATDTASKTTTSESTADSASTDDAELDLLLRATTLSLTSDDFASWLEAALAPLLTPTDDVTSTDETTE